MSSEMLFVLITVVGGGFCVAMGLPGVLTGDLVLRRRYGGRTHYTGMKATVLGAGYVCSGAMIIANGIISGVQGRILLPTMQVLLFASVGAVVVAWVLSFFVAGTAVRER